MKIEKLGLQMYTVRDHMSTVEGVRDAFRSIKAMGYDQAQTAGCAISYEDYGRIAKEEGIEIIGTHDNWNMMLTDPEQAIANHKLLGTKFMGIGGGPGKDFASAEALVEFCKQCNRVGEIIRPHGMKFTYHNHTMEFKKLKGKVAMDIMLEYLDPETTSFCLDTCWTHVSGSDTLEWIEKLSGRIGIIHLKDWGIWDSDNEAHVKEIGNGNLNWTKIMAAAEKAGAQYYVVEQDAWEGASYDSARISAEYIRKNFMK